MDTQHPHSSPQDTEMGHSQPQKSTQSGKALVVILSIVGGLALVGGGIGAVFGQDIYRSNFIGTEHLMWSAFQGMQDVDSSEFTNTANISVDKNNIKTLVAQSSPGQEDTVDEFLDQEKITVTSIYQGGFSFPVEPLADSYGKTSLSTNFDTTQVIQEDIDLTLGAEYRMLDRTGYLQFTSPDAGLGIAETFNNSWYEVSTQLLEEFESSIQTETDELNTELNSFFEDIEANKEDIAEAYQKNRFIEITDRTGNDTINGQEVYTYTLDFDLDKAEAFSEEVEDITFDGDEETGLRENDLLGRILPSEFLDNIAASQDTGIPQEDSQDSFNPQDLLGNIQDIAQNDQDSDNSSETTNTLEENGIEFKNVKVTMAMGKEDFRLRQARYTADISDTEMDDFTVNVDWSFDMNSYNQGLSIEVPEETKSIEQLVTDFEDAFGDVEEELDSLVEQFMFGGFGNSSGGFESNQSSNLNSESESNQRLQEESNPESFDELPLAE